jgi:hypothetical protein
MPQKNRKNRVAVTLKDETLQSIKIIQDEFALVSISSTIDFCINAMQKNMKLIERCSNPDTITNVKKVQE